MYVSEKTAIKLLKKGYVVGIETDTVFGLCVIEKYEHKIYKLKKRDKKKKLISMISQFDEQITSRKLGREIYKSWPGKVTIIFEKKGKFESYRISGSNSVRNLCRGVNEPLKTTSANISGQREVQNDIDFFNTFPSVPLVKKKFCESKSNTPSTIMLYNRNSILFLR